MSQFPYFAKFREFCAENANPRQLNRTQEATVGQLWLYDIDPRHTISITFDDDTYEVQESHHYQCMLHPWMQDLLRIPVLVGRILSLCCHYHITIMYNESHFYTVMYGKFLNICSNNTKRV